MDGRRASSPRWDILQDFPPSRCQYLGPVRRMGRPPAWMRGWRTSSAEGLWMKAPGVVPRHTPNFSRPRGPGGLPCPPISQRALSNGSAPNPVSLGDSPTFSFLHTKPLVPMFSESPHDSRKEWDQSEPPQRDWGWGDSRPWNGVMVSGTRPGGCVLSLSCTDSPASLQKELGHLERLRGDGGRGAWEGRGCWRVVTGKVRTPSPENRWKGLWNGRKD